MIPTDLLDDWLGDEPNDLLTFVPLNWNISIDLTRYEIFLFTNRYNWIDVAMDAAENSTLLSSKAYGLLEASIHDCTLVHCVPSIHNNTLYHYANHIR